MTTYTVDVTVEEMLEVLQNACDRRAIASFDELPKYLELEVEARIGTDLFHDEAVNLGYVHEDDALDGLDPNLRDLTDGLRCLLEGDRLMASALFSRAFDAWPDAARAVEDVLMSRTVRDRRQGALALAV
ncbi:hypothetical protein [Sphingobium sp. B2]|uniref:hypothetical protein n=1 Tax=Sphingobium sp. B2 TaxID=2583228 RepID=UPI0011A06033|nr:hypothetical protein [Sphingobium sp. B2]